MNLLLLVLVGYLLSKLFLKILSLCERVAYTLFFSLTAVPFAVINISLLCSRYITRELFLFVSVALLIFSTLSLLFSKRGRKVRDIPKITRKECAVLLLAVPVAVFAALYYTDSEFFLSLASYLQKGEAKCFYMETFKFIGGLNPGIDPSEIRNVYKIIGTPGNTLFTAGLTPLFGPETFRILYMSFQVLLFLFVFLLTDRLTDRYLVSIGIALFSVLNPCVLSIEVLDRNAMALALSAVLFYTVFAHTEKTFLQGLVFGITSGVGLRFLPLTFAFPVFLFHLTEKTGFRSYAKFLCGFVFTFAFNIPHLFHHGFHSLGETLPLWKLLFLAFTEWTRTPALPHPNSVFYFLNYASHLGYICSSLIIFGAIKMVTRDRRQFFILMSIIFIPFLILSCQRDWIEADKARILLTGFLPLMLFLGAGVSSLLSREKLPVNLALYVTISMITICLVLFVRNIEGTEDGGTYSKKPTYQTMAPSYLNFYTSQFSPVGILPNYNRLFLKTDLRRKREMEDIVVSVLFPGGQNEFKPENRLVKAWLSQTDIKPPAQKKLSDSYFNIRIDFEKLVEGGTSAIEFLDHSDNFFVNFEEKGSLLDIYYKDCLVSWQPEKLPITIFTDQQELRSLRELNIELNAFIGFGTDEYGFVRVNSIDHMVRADLRQRGYLTGMTALPQTDDRCSVLLRIPQDLTVVIRNWIVNGSNGTPYRIDSWVLKISEDGKAESEFFCAEPESYL